MDKPDFPLVWDNTMRVQFITCPRKFAWEFLDHYKPKAPNVHLHAGAAFAKGLEVARRAFYSEGKEDAEAVRLGLEALLHAYGSFQCPPESAKSLNRMAEAYIYYMTVFPMPIDPVQPYIGAHGPMIEFSFAIPLSPDLLHPVTGEPIIYAGRADMIATYAGALSIYDDKTTSSLGPSWGQSWDMRSQFTGYTWAAQEYGIPVTQVVVRGISILKSKLDHAQAISSRSAFRVERWHGQVVRDIQRAIDAWKEGYWDYNEADACSTFSGCLFKQPCMSQDPSPWLEMYFEKRKWDPVHREETPLLPAPTAVEQWDVVGNVKDYLKGKK